MKRKFEIFETLKEKTKKINPTLKKTEMKEKEQIVWKSMFEDITPITEQKKENIKRNLPYFIEEKRSKKELLTFFKKKAKKLDKDPDDLAEEEEESSEEEQ